VELDRGLVAVLRETFAAESEAGLLRVVEGDALDQDLVHLVPSPYDVVANLPYHITSPILHRLLGEAPRARRLVLMVQREVAERVAAAPGGMSYLSVFVQYHAKARVAFRVPREAFEPAPKVESAVLVLEPYPLTIGWARRRTTSGGSSRPPSASSARCCTTLRAAAADPASSGSTRRWRPSAAGDRRSNSGGRRVDRAGRGARPSAGR
jgi:hypothetical protein